MIASRFRSLGLAGAVGIAALGCYLVSQRVASERAGVEALDRRILLARLDIRKLETELLTRSRLPTIEGWNRDVWGLSAPSASQYLHGEMQLASLRMDETGPRVIQVAASPVQTDAQAAPEAVAEPEPQAPMLRHANYVKPAEGSFEAEPRKIALLDESLLADLKQAASREKTGKKQPQ